MYKVKFHPNGTVERLKARLVVRGDKQVEGKYYKATFSHVAKFATVRTLIALATRKNWNLHQLDINNAVYMELLKKMFILRSRKNIKESQY